ncbi:hypothetical protein Tco_0927135 [Tanacetum coccineum]|uniref:Uncharacterized protein n=1 Tax=Tanacetum coccineum TaxID=301880 RepID=A0ABQ5DBT9_9ASTR
MEQMTSLSYGGQIMLKDMKKEAELPEEQADDNSYENIEYVDASPPDVEIDILQQRRTKEFIVPNFFADHPTLHLDLDLILFSEPLFAYIEWIFLPFLTYPVAPPYLLSCGNEDTIFDLGISVYYSFMTGVSHRSGTFIKFNVYLNHLNESPMEILSSTCSHGLLNSVGSESCL